MLTRPTNSSISFGLVPAASMVEGCSISSGMARESTAYDGAVEGANEAELRAGGFDGPLYVMRSRRRDLHAAFQDAGPRVRFEQGLGEANRDAEAWTVPAFCAACGEFRAMHVDWSYAGHLCRTGASGSSAPAASSTTASASWP